MKENEYVFTPDEQAGIQPILDQIKELNGELSSSLRFITRSRKLEGSWSLSPDGTKLVRPDAPKE